MSSRPLRVRRASCLVAFWDHDALIVVNYLTGRETVLPTPLAAILNRLDGYIALEALSRQLAAVRGAGSLLRRLIRRDLLLLEDSPVDVRDRLLASSWDWGPSARFFHFATQRVPYESDPIEGRGRLAEHARRVPPPSPYKEFSAAIPLPGSFAMQDSDFWDVLRRRRTWRRFQRAPISQEALGQVLLWTWGQTRRIDNPDLGSYLLKTSPSGGARHPIEVYPFVRRVIGVKPGIYHYSVKEHALEYLRPPLTAGQLVKLLANQPWVRDAAVVFFMTAVVERSMWKYKHEHAYRVLLLDAGHLGQTFHLVCTKLGLAPFTSSAKQDDAIERVLGIDGISEISLYAAATGVPARDQRSALSKPAEHRTAKRDRRKLSAGS
jgi:SagB-type dehydrogenase family enzyme